VEGRRREERRDGQQDGTQGRGGRRPVKNGEPGPVLIAFREEAGTVGRWNRLVCFRGGKIIGLIRVILKKIILQPALGGFTISAIERGKEAPVPPNERCLADHKGGPVRDGSPGLFWTARPVARHRRAAATGSRVKCVLDALEPQIQICNFYIIFLWNITLEPFSSTRVDCGLPPIIA